MDVVRKELQSAAKRTVRSRRIVLAGFASLNATLQCPWTATG